MPFLKTERSKGLIRIWQFLIAQQTLKDWGELKNLKLNRYRFIEKKKQPKTTTTTTTRTTKNLIILVIGLFSELAHFTRGVFRTLTNIYDGLFSKIFSDFQPLTLS